MAAIQICEEAKQTGRDRKTIGGRCRSRLGTVGLSERRPVSQTVCWMRGERGGGGLVEVAAAGQQKREITVRAWEMCVSPDPGG